MYNIVNYAENIVVSLILLLFSLILTIIVNRCSRKYRIKFQDSPTFTRKWSFNYILAYRDSLRSIAFLFSAYLLMNDVMVYYYFGLSYEHRILVVADIGFCVFSVLLALAFMFKDVEIRSVKMFNKLPVAFRIVIFVISIIISRIIHRNNVNFANF